MGTPHSILIIKLSAIGDVVHSLPFLEVLKENFPDAGIDWVVEEEAFPIIAGHPGLNRVFVSRRKSWQKRILKCATGFSSVSTEVARFLREMRSYKYDLVIDLQGLLRSGVLTGISRGERKIGMAGAREGGWMFLNERPVPVDYNQHAVDRYLKLTEYLGCRPTSWIGRIPVFESDKEWVDNLINTNGLPELPLVAINPVARWETKLWEPAKFAELADRIKNDLRCEVIFTGSKQDMAVVGEIRNKMKEMAVNTAGRTNLKQLAHLYDRCATLVTTDTGPMHMAAAMGCRTVALFGPTAPWRTGPYGRAHKVIRAEVECSPCFKKQCRDMRCMKEITVDRVFEAVKKMGTSSGIFF